MHRHTESKELLIPDSVSVGAVIGRGGCNCKAIREKHRVRCSVDKDNHKVVLTGNRSGVKGAEDELNQLFEKLVVIDNINQNRVYEVVVRDGSTKLWSFEQEQHPSSDFQVKCYAYRLQQADQAEKSPSSSKSWIQEFQENETCTMEYLGKQTFESPLKVKVSFGKLCFKPKSELFPRSAISWTELQNLRNQSHFVTRWSNVCGRTSPAMTALLDELEKEMDNEMTPQFTMLVSLTDRHSLGEKSYELKYHVVDGQWKLHNGHVRRIVHGTYDVIFDNDTSFRVRAVTREKLSDADADDLHRSLTISVPDSDDFYSTKVTLSLIAPRGLILRDAYPKIKVPVMMKGLDFSVVYMDKNREEFRLECRLPVEDQEAAGSADKECQLLLKKVLSALSE
ncbi:hypothetical protein PHMEG_00022532 [Phytophthora megakarya]|uniref:K Homology domain-containing protein n=1 Tax=Phytophthora megakarya TaxID=4795 RepID=A0A225VLI3_9STRA|nr:hypothetical protein PHMEG_00022532 [Phytophthora megakarya]